MQRLIESPEEFTNQGLSPEGRKPVRCYIDGCFDLIHSGHYNAIRQARALCDELVVGSNSDRDVLKFKGPTILNDDERHFMLTSCKWTSEVHKATPYIITEELLDEL